MKNDKNKHSIKSAEKDVIPPHVQAYYDSLLDAIEFLDKESPHLESLASRDPLTDLYKRKPAIEQYRAMISQHTSVAKEQRKDPAQGEVAVIFFDLDHFKANINDKHGHPTGDQALRVVADVMKELPRTGDIPIRWSGDEFAFIANIAKKQDAVLVAEKLRKEINNRSFAGPDGSIVELSASVGVKVVNPDKEKNLEDVLDNLNEALSLSKKSGRNCVSVIDSEGNVAGARPLPASAKITPLQSQASEAYVRAGEELMKERPKLKIGQVLEQMRAARGELTRKTKRNAQHIKGARYDFLTGLANRDGAEELYKQKIAALLRQAHGKEGSETSSRYLNAMLIDIDHFKQVNSKFDQSGGDEALRHTAKLLKSVARESDIVCRWGGEEFLILFESRSPAGACEFAERVREAVEVSPVILPIPKTNELASHQLTISAGTYSYKPSMKNQMPLEEFVVPADAGAYLAKSSGRNKVAWCADDDKKPKIADQTYPARIVRQDRAVIAHSSFNYSYPK